MKDDIDLTEITERLTQQNQKYGAGYITFLLMHGFRLQFPNQVRWQTDPRHYTRNFSSDIFDVISVKRTQDAQEQQIPDTYLYAHCYLCGSKISEISVPIGTTNSFYLCKNCNGSLDTVSDEDAQQIHKEIEKIKESSHGSEEEGRV